MRWPGASLRWVRPLTSIICLFDGEIVPLAIDGVPVGRTTRGHRFMSPGEFCADSAAEYRDKLQHAYVMLDQDRRRELIRADLDRRAAELQADGQTRSGAARRGHRPRRMAGRAGRRDRRRFHDLAARSAAHLDAHAPEVFRLPRCRDGSAGAAFPVRRQHLAEDGGKAIVAGNERVLRARLTDARFFWDQDRKIRLEDRVEALKDRVFHAKLGTMYEKVERIGQLGGVSRGTAFTPSVVTPRKRGSRANRSRDALRSLDSRFRGNDDGELSRLAQRAAHLAKADLSTGMVGEFPELQGIMGRYYALHDGEDAESPTRSPITTSRRARVIVCPTAPVSIAVALADKLDTLVGFFAIGEKPTGSRDPFALRRAALGCDPDYPRERLALAADTGASRAARAMFGCRQIAVR